MLVFIHGGDFFNGANFIYPGYFQASYGVVTVTVNYRLNILGKQTLAANTQVHAIWQYDLTSPKSHSVL